MLAIDEIPIAMELDSPAALAERSHVADVQPAARGEVCIQAARQRHCRRIRKVVEQPAREDRIEFSEGFEQACIAEQTLDRIVQIDDPDLLAPFLGNEPLEA